MKILKYTMQLGFEEEIAWAIDQLHLGIISNRDKKAEGKMSY